MWSHCRSVAGILNEHHYLGPIARGVAWHDQFGVIVITRPTARNIPHEWLELARWCIVSKETNAGSQQWASFVRALRKANRDATTIVSYSDPSKGHTGALYRACNWQWAPTWHRLRPPPTGNGTWTDQQQHVKDRWIFPLRPDDKRKSILAVNDEALAKQMPWASYPGDFKRWKSMASRSFQFSTTDDIKAHVHFDQSSEQLP